MNARQTVINVETSKMLEAEFNTENVNPGCPGDSAGSCCEAASGSDGHEHVEAETTTEDQQDELLQQFPPEIAMLLIMAGVAGVLLPGPIGAPLILAGGVTLWPKTFRPMERWFRRKFPAMHQEGVIQLKEFVKDLKSRFPN